MIIILFFEEKKKELAISLLFMRPQKKEDLVHKVRQALDGEVFHIIFGST